MQHSCSHSNAICNHSFKKRIELRTQEQPLLQTQRRNQTTPAAPAAHTRYLSSPAGATLHGKTQGFVLRLPPHNTRHAAFMQPFQCDLQPQLQETNRTTHTGTTIVAKHIEGTKRPQPHPSHTRGTFIAGCSHFTREKHKVSCSGFPRTTHGMQHSCSHSNAICNHRFKKRKELRTQEQHGITTRCRTQRRNQSRLERPQPQPPHTRGTFHRRLQPLHTENYKVSCYGFLPNTSGMQH